jgi:hypothetical protein
MCPVPALAAIIAHPLSLFKVRGADHREGRRDRGARSLRATLFKVTPGHHSSNLCGVGLWGEPRGSRDVCESILTSSASAGSSLVAEGALPQVHFTTTPTRSEGAKAPLRDATREVLKKSRRSLRCSSKGMLASDDGRPNPRRDSFLLGLRLNPRTGLSHGNRSTAHVKVPRSMNEPLRRRWLRGIPTFFESSPKGLRVRV